MLGVVSGALYFVLLPKYGNVASAWLTLGAETALLIASAVAFHLAVRRPEQSSSWLCAMSDGIFKDLQFFPPICTCYAVKEQLASMGE